MQQEVPQQGQRQGNLPLAQATVAPLAVALEMVAVCRQADQETVDMVALVVAAQTVAVCRQADQEMVDMVALVLAALEVVAAPRPVDRAEADMVDLAVVDLAVEALGVAACRQADRAEADMVDRLRVLPVQAPHRRMAKGTVQRLVITLPEWECPVRELLALA